MTIATRVITDVHSAAMITLFDMAAQSGCTALSYRLNGFSLLIRDSMMTLIMITITLQNIRHFKRGFECVIFVIAPRYRGAMHQYKLSNGDGILLTRCLD